MTITGRVLATILLLGLHVSHVAAAECADVRSASGKRYIAAISDLHFGVGRTEAARWDPTEDFRWPRALAGFLREVSRCGSHAVDLVIAGDALELWQPPATIRCDGPSDALCRPDQFLDLIRLVVAAHRDDLALLGEFARKGDNRLLFVPGNHDAALLLPGAWEIVADALGAPGRATLVAGGSWVSDDGQVVIEHGHQMGRDVNRFSAWPVILRQVSGESRVESPWGERFVQRLFNEQEGTYPIIDNLSPESAGARYRMADRGVWKSAADVARFLHFNLFETSLAQKGSFLGGGESGPTNRPPEGWDIAAGRAMGHELFTLALPTDDPFVVASQAADEQAAALRSELGRLAATLPPEDISELCDRVAVATDGKRRCVRTLGYAVQGMVRAKSDVVAAYLREVLARPGHGRMRTYVYGHTHLLETRWPVRPIPGREVSVHNTGAFQRVVDEPGFLARARARGLAAPDALKALSVEDLAPCYGAVLIGLGTARPQGKTVLWRMAEDAAEGAFVEPADPACR